MKTSSGRNRYNVLGALNFVSGRMETVCNNTYITATQVVEMLEMLAAKCCLPIHIVIDYVPYQKCQLVKETLVKPVAAIALAFNLLTLALMSELLI